MDESIVDGNALDDGLLERWERYFLLTAEEALIDNELEVTLLDGLLHLRDNERYRNDDRYLKLWMRYADSTDDASKVFKMLRSYNIGTQLALFWAGWAYVLEKGELYSKAMGVLQKGKRRGAQPASLLEEFEGAFCRRMRERMRVARSNLAQRVIEQKTVVSVIPKRPDCTTHRSLTIREQLMDAGTSVQSLPTSSRSLRHIRCSSGPKALQEPADQRGMEAKIASGVCRSHMHHRVSRSKENQVTKTAYRRVLGAHSEAPSGMREEKSSGSADTPLRELDVNTQYLESPRFRNPGKKSCKVGKLHLIRDPFSEDMRKDLTVESPQYVRWLTSNNGVVHDVRNESLTKRWPRKTGTAKRGSRRRIVSAQTLGAQRLEVMGMLGEGAFATVYACKVDARYDVAVKIELQKCTALSLPWECFVTLQLRDRLSHQCDAEPTPVQSEIEVIAPTALHLFSDGSAMTMPQGRYGTVHDLVIMYQKNSQAMPQLVVMHYAIQMLRFCRAMHSASILHMDIKPDNWLLTTTKRRECGMSMNHTKTGGDGRRSSHSLSLIDFGRAIDLSVFHDNGSAVSFTGKCCPSNFSCPAMLEGRVWKYDADLFALGSCIHFMLHGAYLEVDCDESKESDSASSKRPCRWRPKRQCRRYWEVNLWNHLFDELLNSDGCGNGHAKTEAILIRLEQSITTFIMDGRRSLELAEFLRIQDNMFRSNS